MAIRVVEMPEESGTIALLKTFSESLLKAANTYSEKYWPTKINGFRVNFLSKESCTIEVENSDKHLVEFTYGIEDGKPVWCLVEDTYTNPLGKDFWLLLPA